MPDVTTLDQLEADLRKAEHDLYQAKQLVSEHVIKQLVELKPNELRNALRSMSPRALAAGWKLYSSHPRF
jgi:hypothetical protein